MKLGWLTAGGPHQHSNSAASLEVKLAEIAVPVEAVVGAGRLHQGGNCEKLDQQSGVGLQDDDSEVVLKTNRCLRNHGC